MGRIGHISPALLPKDFQGSPTEMVAHASYCVEDAIHQVSTYDQRVKLWAIKIMLDAMFKELNAEV